MNNINPIGCPNCKDYYTNNTENEKEIKAKYTEENTDNESLTSACDWLATINKGYINQSEAFTRKTTEDGCEVDYYRGKIYSKQAPDGTFTQYYPNGMVRSVEKPNGTKVVFSAITGEPESITSNGVKKTFENGEIVKIERVDK